MRLVHSILGYIIDLYVNTIFDSIMARQICTYKHIDKIVTYLIIYQRRHCKYFLNNKFLYNMRGMVFDQGGNTTKVSHGL